MLILILLLGLFVLALLAVWIATMVWVCRDANSLGKPGIVIALLVGLIWWPVGLLIWLILRGDYRKSAAMPSAPPPVPRACPCCGRMLASETAQGLCPSCLLQQGMATESGARGASAFTPPALSELALLFPQMEILELLGRGGMGAVYKARQPALNRFVALKVLPVAPGADPAFAERFLREARALASLSHPHIVSVHDFGQVKGFSYLVMEYVDGANLRQLQQAARLSPREALAIVPQICEALQFAHDHGIVHRDIKPENILVDTQGRVKVADFGLAKLLRAEPGNITLTEAHNAVGTPQYMAPEQIERPHTVDHRADIYSLGVVFYQMLTGELPLGRFAPPSQKVQIDVRLDEVVLKTLEKEPERRYQQVSEVKTRVETIRTGDTPGTRAVSTSAPLVPPTASAIVPEIPRTAGLRQAVGRRWAVAGCVMSAMSLLCIPWVLLALPPAFFNSDSASDLASSIASVLVPIVMGSVTEGLGLVCIAIALLGYNYRANWFFWATCVIAGLAIPSVPAGTVIGILLLVYVTKRRSEFVSLPMPTPPVFAEPCTKTAGVPPAPTGPAGVSTSRDVGPATPSPRFSRVALVGVFWLAFAAVLLPIWFLRPPHPIPVGEVHQQTTPLILREAVRFLLLALGFSIPLVTTICGAVAVSQIRHSAGRLCGLGLAVFDLLLFPLLVLDAALIAGVFVLLS